MQTRTATRTGATWTTTLTTALAAGTYTAQATQTDTAGNTGTSTANTFTVDTTKPAAAGIAAANKAGGTAGKIENGDTLTFTYSEPITAASVWSGWNGASTAVNVRFTDVATADTVTVLSPTTGTVKLGTVATKGNYVTATTTFASTMVRSADGASIIVTLGTPASVAGHRRHRQEHDVDAGRRHHRPRRQHQHRGHRLHRDRHGRRLLMAAARSRIATALVALGLFAAACMGGDHGAARAAVGQATGPLIGSSLAGAAILEATGLAPGHLRTGEITMTNVGDVSGFFALGASGLVDTPLGRALDLVVEDVTPGQAGRTVFYGKLSALSTVGLGNMSQGEAHRYRFTVSLPSNADNSYQGAATAISFTWSATGEDPGETSAPTPGPPATVQKPPKATTAGATTQAPAATLTARARQTGSGGAVSAGWPAAAAAASR